MSLLIAPLIRISHPLVFGQGLDYFMLVSSVFGFQSVKKVCWLLLTFTVPYVRLFPMPVNSSRNADQDN